jgi:lipoate-protein ligase A
MTLPWRLLRDRAASGVWNMAVDETLAASALQRGVCSLRFYRWDGPWLSLGYGQRASAEKFEVCRRVGVGVVRRVSGGRAVLHGGDLTYSISAPSQRLPAGLQASYELVARALLGALVELGVRAERSQPGSTGPRRSEFDCFAAPIADEICVAGRKLVGSAQRRAGGALLQHGSIRLWPDPPAVARACELHGARATSLRQVGCGVSFEELEEACAGAFRAVLGVCLEPGELAAPERQQARVRCCFRATDALRAPPLTAASIAPEASRVQIDDR